MMEFVRTIEAIDAHTAGEPIRVVTSGIPKIPGGTMLEKMDYFARHYDGIRQMILKEPRGHKDMFGAVLVPPVTDDADLGILFMHNEGMSTMCGHGTIGTVKAAAETGLLTLAEGENIIKIDAPAGRITAEAVVAGGRVRSVAFTNVPAFVYKKEIVIPVDGVGDVTAAVVYGGAFYIFIEEEKLGLKVLPENTAALTARAMEMKRWVNANMDVHHPEKPDIRDIYGVIIMSPDTRTEGGCAGRHICVFAEGAVDRSPCGTGTSARMALLVARGRLAIGEKFNAASIIDTKFEGTPLASVKECGYDAIIPKVAGGAWITGFNRFVLDPSDPLPEGFLI
ncbi:MAG: proline racemase family protein [Cloacibacillus sp.]